MQHTVPLSRYADHWARTTLTCIALAVSASLSANAQNSNAGKPDFSWQQTQTSIALLNNGSTVWEHVHDSEIGKPYMRIGLLDGTELTRPWPVPAGYAKNDHVWHKALWWSWKILDGHNFWEENQQGTEPTEVKVTKTPEGAAQIDIKIAYHLPGQAPMLMEKRRITVSQPDATGSYLIDWHTTFTPAGPKDVVFAKYRYGGLSIRMAGEFCGTDKQAAWTFSANTDKVTANGTSVPIRWMAYQGMLPKGQAATLAILAHPDNPGSAPTWLVRDNYPYMNPTFPGKLDYTLKTSENLSLRYGILVHQGLADKAKLESDWQDYAKSAAKELKTARFDPVEKDIEGWTVHVDPQMLKGEHSQAGVKALKMLANHLQRVAVLMPADKLAEMRKLEIWIEHQHPTLGSMQYHPSIGWLRSHGHDPRLAKKVHIPRAKALLSRQQMIKHPAVVLHELAHAYHDQVLSFDNPRIIEVFKKAKDAGIYEKSLLYTGKRVRHYGLSNHKEYFAEGTEAYFYRNDFYPFCRAELQQHDPRLHDLLVAIWGPLQ
jgi:hypothetical protein